MLTRIGFRRRTREGRGILTAEQLWKAKLQRREMGLNRN